MLPQEVRHVASTHKNDVRNICDKIRRTGERGFETNCIILFLGELGDLWPSISLLLRLKMKNEKSEVEVFLYLLFLGRNLHCYLWISFLLWCSLSFLVSFFCYLMFQLRIHFLIHYDVWLLEKRSAWSCHFVNCHQQNLSFLFPNIWYLMLCLLYYIKEDSGVCQLDQSHFIVP